MSRRRDLVDAWSKFGVDVLHRLPHMTPEVRRWVEVATAPQRMMGEMHEAWLESVGGVSRRRYLKVVEENLELRRRVEALEKNSTVEGKVAATHEAIDDAFNQIKDAQEQWMSMWLPPSGAKRPK